MKLLQTNINDLELPAREQFADYRNNGYSFKDALWHASTNDDGQYMTNMSERKEAQKQEDFNNKNYRYVFQMSHSRAIGRLSRTADVQLFNGSSHIGRKKRLQKKEAALQNGTQATDADISATNGFNARSIQGLLHRQATRRSQYLQGGKAMSHRTRQKIRDKILAMYDASEEKAFTMVTLSFISKLTDQTGVDCLNKFFTVLRERFGHIVYVWVAERQTTGFKGSAPTNNVHFHIVMGRSFTGLEKVEFNALWVAQQFNAGIDHKEIRERLYRDHGETFQSLQRTGYTGWKKIQHYLNPADFRKLKTIDGVSAYLTNYVTKNTDKFNCANWNCSREVSEYFTTQLIPYAMYLQTLNKRKNSIRSRDGKKTYTGSQFTGSHCTIVSIVNKRYYRTYISEVTKLNRWINRNREQINREQYFDNFDTEISWDDYRQRLFKYIDNKSFEIFRGKAEYSYTYN